MRRARSQDHHPPWDREGSSFTLPFEGWVVELAKHLPFANGKDAANVDRFAEDFAAHKGDTEAIKIVTCDMSLGFNEVNLTDKQLERKEA